MRLLQFPHARAARAGRAEDVCSVHLEVERGAVFCANPECALHVRRVDARFGNLLLCDACGALRGPVRLPAPRN
jgi:hypothetical protein